MEARRMERLTSFLRSELALAAILIVVLWLKFYTFDSSISQRFRLTPLTSAGGAGVLLCLASPAALLPRRARGAGFVALDAALSLVILTDSLTLRYYTDLFSLYNIGLHAQAAEVSDSIIALIEPGDALYFADILLFALLSWSVSRRGGWGAVTARRAAAAVALAVLGGFCVAWRIDSYDRAVPGAIRALWDRPAVAVSVGSLVYHAADVFNIAADRLTGKNYSSEDESRLYAWLEARAGGRGRRGATFGAAKGKNLIMIQAESLQAFVVGLTADGVEVAPNISRLAREGIHFTRAYNQTAGGNSSDAELMSNASLFPASHGAAFARFAGNSYISLGTELASRGYATVAFHGDRPGFWNRNHMYPALGFGRFISKNEFAPGEGIGLGLSDGDFFKQSLGRLADIRDDGPFYAFLVTLTSHHPFNFAGIKKHVSPQWGDVGGRMLGDYLLAIRYADTQIGGFLAGLEREGLLDESVIVLYGDHPAIQRGDADALGALLGRDLSSVAAWRGIQSVPIIIRLPHGEFAGETDVAAGQIDIAPTVASIMGFSIATAFGDDLLDPALSRDEKMTVFRNGSFVKGGEWVRPGEERAFDLRMNEGRPWSETSAASAARAAELLSMSDMLIERGMIRKIRGNSLNNRQK
jgi:phosphoglycerol transferase MdoB-like AlkP superfamily enzyme